MKFYILFLSLLSITSAQTCDFSGTLCQSIQGCGDSSLNRVQVGQSTYNGFEYDAVSFADLTLTNGDIQGRVLVSNNLYASGGISIADKIDDSSIPSLIVGGSVFWSGSGATYPLDSAVYVGGQANFPSSFNTTRLISASSNSLGGLTDISSYWKSFSTALAGAASSNVVVCSDNGGIVYLTCASSSAIYYVNFDASALGEIGGFCTSGCSSAATWIFNIGGTADVYFGGVAFDTAGTVVYNIIDSGAIRNVIVNTSVYGNIVAPNANLNQVAGTIYGQVIASNITDLVQINRPSCGNSSTSTGSASGSTSDSSDNDNDNDSDNDNNAQCPDSAKCGYPSATTSGSSDSTTATGSVTTSESSTDDGSSASQLSVAAALVIIVSLMI